MRAFRPRGETKKIEATTTSANVAIDQEGSSVKILVKGDGVVAFFAFGTADTVTAASSNAARFPLVGTSDNVIYKTQASTHVAVETEAGTADVFFTPGDGK